MAHNLESKPRKFLTNVSGFVAGGKQEIPDWLEALGARFGGGRGRGRGGFGGGSFGSWGRGGRGGGRAAGLGRGHEIVPLVTSRRVV